MYYALINSSIRRWKKAKKVLKRNFMQDSTFHFFRDQKNTIFYNPNLAYFSIFRKIEFLFRKKNKTKKFQRMPILFQESKVTQIKKNHTRIPFMR